MILHYQNGKFLSTVPSSRSFLRFGLQQVGNAVFIAFFFAFLFLGGFTFDMSPGTVALAVAVVDVLDALLLFVDAVDVHAMALFGGRLLIITDFVFVLVFFLRLGFIDTIGSSSDAESVDPCILIKRSMFLTHVVVHMGEGIFCGSVNIYNGGGSWCSTSTLL
jgi:hypothetical protein